MEKDTVNTNSTFDIKIASLNLNGETWNLNNKKPRLPKDLFDTEKIKKSLTDKLLLGLYRLLKTNEYDVIAVQELVYFFNHLNEIKELIKTLNYELIIPDKIGKGTHFTVGFIVRKESTIKIETIKNLEGLTPHNRQVMIKCNIKEINFILLNLHINKKEHYKAIKEYISDEKGNKDNIIILGDMNACTAEQIEKRKKLYNSGFITFFLEKGFTYADGYNKSDFTYLTGGVWRKLDHIFLSNKFVNSNKILSVTETKNDIVNFYVNEENGFTDHSMLALDIKFTN